MCVCVCVCVGAQGPRMDMKSCHITVGMPRSMDLRRKGARGEEEMSQSTLKHSKWGRESKERERERERERINGHRGNF